MPPISSIHRDSLVKTIQMIFENRADNVFGFLEEKIV